MTHVSVNCTLRHVGLIPDGGRRWAKEKEVPLLESYVKMMRVIALFVDTMMARDVGSVTVYLLSKENLQRKTEELKPVIQAEIELMNDL
jgi:undecaprenyl diphosphate synthase